MYFQSSFDLFLSLEKVLHIGGQVIEGLNSRVSLREISIFHLQGDIF